MLEKGKGTKRNGASSLLFSPKFSAFAQGDFCPLSCAAVRDFLFLLERGFAPFQTPRKKVQLSGFPTARGIPHQKGTGLRFFPIMVGVWGSEAPPCNNNRVAIITENPCGMQYRSFPSGKSTGLLPSRFILRNRTPGIGTHWNAQQGALLKRKTMATHEKAVFGKRQRSAYQKAKHTEKGHDCPLQV